MAKKIKVVIKSPEKNINLPRISVKTAIRFVRFGLWTSKFFTESDEEFQIFLRNNKELMLDFLKAIEKELKDLEPFTLVKVESDQQFVLIDIV